MALPDAQVMLDYVELAPDAQGSLRDALLSLLGTRFAQGPKAVTTQLCLALADLALQMESWTDAYQTVASSLPLPIVLEWIRILPEEIRGNNRIVVPVRSSR